MATADLLLYTAKICPYAHRAELALAESNQDFERYEIDLQKKPEWYESKVNKASKVPVLVVRNGKQGSDAYLPESLVVAEYIAEAFASQKGGEALLPEDPLDKARIRYVIERFSQLFGPAFGAAFRERDAAAVPKTVEALKQFQELLPAEGPYFLGKRYSLAEVAISPFVGRLLLYASSGLLPASDVDVAKVVSQDPSLKRLSEWWSAVIARPSWAKTFDEATLLKQAKGRVAQMEKAAASKK